MRINLHSLLIFLACTLRDCQYTAIYNTIRPHGALGYLTPQQFLRQVPSQRKE